MVICVMMVFIVALCIGIVFVGIGMLVYHSLFVFDPDNPVFIDTGIGFCIVGIVGALIALPLFSYIDEATEKELAMVQACADKGGELFFVEKYLNNTDGERVLVRIRECVINKGN